MTDTATILTAVDGRVTISIIRRAPTSVGSRPRPGSVPMGHRDHFKSDGPYGYVAPTIRFPLARPMPLAPAPNRTSLVPPLADLHSHAHTDSHTEGAHEGARPAATRHTLMIPPHPARHPQTRSEEVMIGDFRRRDSTASNHGKPAHEKRRMCCHVWPPPQPFQANRSDALSLSAQPRAPQSASHALAASTKRPI